MQSNCQAENKLPWKSVKDKPGLGRMLILTISPLYGKRYTCIGMKLDTNESECFYRKTSSGEYTPIDSISVAAWMYYPKPYEGVELL